MLLPLLIVMATWIPCDLDYDQCITPGAAQCESPTPTIKWDAIPAGATGYYLEWKYVSSDTSEPYVRSELIPCSTWPVDTDYEGELYCPGEKGRVWNAQDVPLQRFITAEPGYLIEVCVRAEKDGAESANCSALLSNICWPELLIFP